MAEVSGDKKIIQQLEQFKKLKLRNLRVGISKATAFLLRESQNYVPVDSGKPGQPGSGALKRSGKAQILPESTPTRIVGSVSYHAEYAVFVHEIPDAPPPPPGWKRYHVTHGWAFNMKHRFEIMKGLERERGPNQQYKYLEKPAREKRKEIRDIIVAEVSKDS